MYPAKDGGLDRAEEGHRLTGNVNGLTATERGLGYRSNECLVDIDASRAVLQKLRSQITDLQLRADAMRASFPERPRTWVKDNKSFAGKGQAVVRDIGNLEAVIATNGGTLQGEGRSLVPDAEPDDLSRQPRNLDEQPPHGYQQALDSSCSVTKSHADFRGLAESVGESWNQSMIELSATRKLY